MAAPNLKEFSNRKIKKELSRVGEECENIDLVTAVGFSMAVQLSIIMFFTSIKNYIHTIYFRIGSVPSEHFRSSEWI